MEKEFKFFSKGLLREANEAAHREKRSRCIDPMLLEEYPLDFVYYVVRYMYHKKNELRLFVLKDSNGEIDLIDTSVIRYNALPSIIFSDDGSYKVKFGKRPYPNFRAWQESETIKPVRKQNKFRTQILHCYNNTCAVCNINDKALLRAAHIIDVKYGGKEETNNGICLCVNHEIAFDRGLLKILPDYSVEHNGGIGVLAKSIKLPNSISDYPSKFNLEKKLGHFN